MEKTTSRSTSKRKVTLPPVKKQAVHYTAPYLIDPQHPVTINVIGCGGTGSQVLNSLARMHSALRALGHPGLFVRAVDPDKVTVANMGRQLFSPADVDDYKCMVLVGRINRFFGTDWKGIAKLYNKNTDISAANITISCVDSGMARFDIKQALDNAKTEADRSYIDPYKRPYYWMDFGNTMKNGQVVIGTVSVIEQPKNSEFTCKSTLPTIDQLHPDIFKDTPGEDQGPSCSLAEALQKQDLFINTNLANMGLAILWKMFRDLRIQNNGLYLNLENLVVNPIKIR